VMNYFASSLGRRCNFCHVNTNGQWDYAADTKPEKNTAREMIREFEGDPRASCNSLSTKIKEVEDAVRRAAEERAASEGGRSADLVPSGVVEPTPPVEPNPANPINRRKK